MKKYCKNCKFFKDSDNEDTDYFYKLCRRYPQTVDLFDIDRCKKHWCGEYKPKANKKKA